MNHTWALHVRPATGPDLLLVIEVPAELTAPPAVHKAITIGGTPDRYLTTLGWQPARWQPRSYGAVASLHPRHPHT